MDLLKIFCTLNHTQVTENSLEGSLVPPLTFKSFIGGSENKKGWLEADGAVKDHSHRWAELSWLVVKCLQLLGYIKQIVEDSISN